MAEIKLTNESAKFLMDNFNSGMVKSPQKKSGDKTKKVTTTKNTVKKSKGK